MRSILTILLTLLFLENFAQKENVLIKFCPLSLFDDISFPTIQGGIEFKLSDKLTWYNEAGIKYRKSYIDNSDTSFIKSSGFKLKTEIRLYFQRKHKTTFDGFYFAANAFFTNDRHNTEISYQTNSSSVTDAFDVKKTVFGINLPLGYQKTRRKIIFDFYCGPGIRFRNITTFNKEYNKNNDAIISAIDLNIPSLRKDSDANDEGASVVPNLTMGFRICYKL